jgi:hypothetical protein
MGGYSVSDLFGRRWRISVVTDNGKGNIKQYVVSDSEQDEEQGRAGLHCLFHIEHIGYRVPNYSDIKIYNLEASTEETLIQEGKSLIIEAGYKDPTRFGVIFNGKIFQAVRYRENVTDYVLDIQCIDGLDFLYRNFVNQTIAAGGTPFDVAQMVASQAISPIQATYVSRDLTIKKLPRGRVLFGEPKDILSEIAEDYGAEWFIENGQLYMARMDEEVNPDSAIVVSPEDGLVSIPQQVPDGITFRCLLDPRFKIRRPPMMVKLYKTEIRERKKQLGEFQTPPAPDGFYKIAAVIHTGDTRGNEWYTDITGLGSLGRVLMMQQTLQTDIH